MFNINNLELVKMNNRPDNSALEQNMIFEQEAKFLSANGIYVVLCRSTAVTLICYEKYFIANSLIYCLSTTSYITWFMIFVFLLSA